MRWATEVLFISHLNWSQYRGKGRSLGRLENVMRILIVDITNGVFIKNVLKLMENVFIIIAVLRYVFISSGFASSVDFHCDVGAGKLLKMNL